MHPVRERKLHFGFLIIPVIMLVIGVYAYRIPDQQTRQGEWVAHTHEVLAQLAFLSLHLTDAETGQRGYLLTGQAVYLNSYSLALQHIDSDMTLFRQLTEDNPRQQSQVPLLRGQIAAKLAELKQTIQLHNSLRPEAALKVVFDGRGRRQMEVIQSQIEQMQAEQQSLLQQRVGLWKVASAQTRWTFLSGGALLYALLGIVSMIARKETRYRKRLMKVEQQATQIQRMEAERLAEVVAVQHDVVCAGQDLQATMQTIVERTRQITCAEGCVAAMVEDGNLVFRYASGTATPHLGLRLKADGSLAGLCMRKNSILKTDNAETDERVNKAVCREVGFRSLLVVPLHSGGRTVGVLKVLSSRIEAFTEEDVATLDMLGGVLSATLSTGFALDALRVSEERLEEAQKVAHVGSWELDLVTQQVTWSKEVFRLFGMAPEWGQPDYATALTLYAPESAARLEACMQSTLRDGGGFAIDLQQDMVAGAATPRWYHLVGKPILDARGKVIRLVGTLLDITESKHHARDMQTTNDGLTDTNTELETANGLLQVQATSDGLTGLQNHRSFQERLAREYQRAVRYKTSLSLVLLDVDHFKPFNDTFGHPAGDGVLRNVAALLQAAARNSDLVARYGGEEFVLLLPETDALGVASIAERIRETIANATWDKRAITVSVGTATLDMTTASATHLVDTADKALYQSKAKGRNRVTHAGGVPFLLEDGTYAAVCRVA